MLTQDITDKLISVLLFIIIGFLIVKYLLKLNISESDQINLIISMTILYMFITTYYPSCIFKNNLT